MVTDNNTIDLEESQDLTAEEAKASLGISTRLMDDFLRMQGQQNQEQSQEVPEEQNMGENEAETPETDKEAPQDDIGAKMTELEAKIQEMEKSTKDTIRAEISGIKDMIKEALSEDEQE